MRDLNLKNELIRSDLVFKFFNKPVLDLQSLP